MGMGRAERDRGVTEERKRRGRTREVVARKRGEGEGRGLMVKSENGRQGGKGR